MFFCFVFFLMFLGVGFSICILFITLNFWTRSIPSTTRIRESADVMRTFDEIPGANCLDKLISNWKVSTKLVSQSKHTNHLYNWKSAEQGERKREREGRRKKGIGLFLAIFKLQKKSLYFSFKFWKSTLIFNIFQDWVVEL